MTAVAIHAGGSVAFPLGDTTTGRQWVIGRAKDADIVIDDASVSRRHAVLSGGADFTIEDLGSENGTTIVVRAPSVIDETARLVPHRLRPGERAILGPTMHAQLGSVTLLLQPGTAPWQAPAPGASIPLPAGVIVTSAAMKHVFWLAERFAQGTINMLLLGETGVGKEVVAEHIHRASPRNAGPFVRLNCASFRGDLLESELFGYERGAFTGAVAAKRGLVEVADGGTMLLDEVGEMPLDLQARLLRFLEDRRAMRLGATDSRQVDVRTISATNRDLPAEVNAGRFRSDLYFRLNGVSLEIPPLRTRPEDIAPLAEHFVRLHAEALGLSPPPTLDPGALAALKRQALPGNARELRNLIERALLLAEPGQPVREDQLMIAPGAPKNEPAQIAASKPTTSDQVDDDDEERQRVLTALEECAGNQTRAAKRLGLTRRALIVRLERYGIARPRR
jgi:two-component system, NtrC family, response regulator AtoC